MRGTSLQQLTNVTAEELNTRVISSTSGRRWPLVLRIRHLSDSEARGWPQRAALATALAEEKCDHHAMMAAACLGPSCALWTASRSGRRPSPTLLACPAVWGRSPPPTAGYRRHRARRCGPRVSSEGGANSAVPRRCGSISPILRARRGRAPHGREEHPGAPRSPLPQASQIVGPQPAVALPTVLLPAVRAEVLALLVRHDARGPRLVYATTPNAGTAAPTGATTTPTVCSSAPPFRYLPRSAYPGPIFCRCC